MKIVIVNDIHIGKPLVHEGVTRASSHLVEPMLAPFLEKIIERHSPDLLINLGDLIRSETKEHDLIAYHKALQQFETIKVPTIHLVGNHELKQMTLEEVETIWQKFGLSQKSYGRKDYKTCSVIWIGLDRESHDRQIRFIPESQVQWLEIQLREIEKPILLFSHCPLDNHNVTGNFFYEETDNRSKKGLFLRNQEILRKMITDSGQVAGVCQAHLHYFHSKPIKGIPFITCPAMGDNICGPHVTDHIPEVYTLLTLEEKTLSAKSYSDKYCFAGYEWENPLPQKRIHIQAEEELEQHPHSTAELSLQTFFQKGGHLHPISDLLEGDEPAFQLQKEDAIYPICSGGWCRSQTLWALLHPFSDKIVLFPPHAARLGWDPFNGKTNRDRLCPFRTTPDEFSTWFGQDKALRFGFENTDKWDPLQKAPTEEGLNEITRYYDQGYFGPNSIWQGKKGKRRIYIAFATNVHVVLHRLNQANDQLNSVTVVAIDSEDIITSPPASWNTPSRSVKAYAQFAEALKKALDIRLLA